MINRLLTENPGKTWTAAMIICIRIFVDLSYKYVVSPLFYDTGFYDHTNLHFEVISWVILLSTVPFYLWLMESDKDRSSSIVFQLLYFFSFLPFTTCIRFGLFDIRFIVYGSIFWGFMFLAEYTDLSTKIIPLPRLVGSQKICEYTLTFIAAVSLFVTVYMSYKYTGFRLHFNIYTVYDIRAEAEKYDVPLLLNYLFGWAEAVNPFMISYCMIRKHWPAAVMFAVCTLLSFGYDGNKTVLFFSILFIFFTLAFMIKRDINTKKLIIMMFMAVATFSLVEYYIFGTFHFVNLFIRRTMLVENNNSYYYFSFFTTHTPDYFKQSFLRYLGYTSDYPDLARMIGKLYFRENTNANCGLIADAIANFGLLGVIGYPLVYFCLMKAFDSVSEGLNNALKVCTALYVSLYLVNSFVITSLFSHGIILLFVMIYLMTSIAVSKKNDEKTTYKKSR